MAGCMTRMVTLTAPGVEVLPWDEEHCAWRGPHKHSGPDGCRVQVAALNVWSSDRAAEYHRLQAAARKQAGVREPVVLARAAEPQQRGPVHWHLVVAATPAGERFTRALLELAPRYGFGTVRDQGYTSKGAYAHAHYLAKYLSKEGADQESARGWDVAYSLLPRKPVWVSPILTRRSGTTMEVAKLLRSVWAFEQGYRESLPSFRDGVVEAWVYWWRRVSIKGRATVRRSVVPRDYGSFEPWATLAWPGERWTEVALAA